MGICHMEERMELLYAKKAVFDTGMEGIVPMNTHEEDGMAGLNLQHVTKAYPNGFVAVKDLDLEIQDGEFLVFAGAEGCGKSTALRMIAGLEDITSGTLLIDGVPMNEVEPRERDIAMIFRNYELYPHMNVYENLAFGLRLKRVPQEEMDRRIQAAAELLGISGVMEKEPGDLTDLQRQQVVLARAVVREPKVFLLDEPFSGLEPGLRKQMWQEAVRLHEKLGTTFIYVTDNPAEAMALGQRIAFMKDGAVQQAGTPQELSQEPESISVAGYLAAPRMHFVKIAVREEGGRPVLLWDGEPVEPEEKLGAVLKECGYVGKSVNIGICCEEGQSEREALAAGNRLYIFDRETGMRVKA